MKIVKAPVGIELITLRFIVNARTYCAMLLGNKYLYLIVYFDKNFVTKKGVPYHLNLSKMNSFLFIDMQSYLRNT